MSERNLAKELSLLATEVDSVAKALVQANAERAREAERRNRADAKAEQLREELKHARQRAQVAERELGKLSAGVQASEHSAVVRQHELETRLEEALRSNAQLQEEVERKERQRRALEQNLRELMENLRNAAQEAHGSTVVAPVATPEDATLVPTRQTEIGW
jgi:chromosome segregation ATPase